MKVVINKCYGGFNLSRSAVILYATRKGLTVYPEPLLHGTAYWIVPKHERVAELPNWSKASREERQEYNRAYFSQTINEYDLPRDDRDLVAVVEAMGLEASGSGASLHVIEIPDGIDWEVKSHDGLERVEERHRCWS
jgi:hypothetical protein